MDWREAVGLVLFWLIDSRGILGTAIQYLVGDPTLSLKASTGLMWVSLIVYGVWHAAPFAFVIFYAGLQTVNQDTLESAPVLLDQDTVIQYAGSVEYAA